MHEGTCKGDISKARIRELIALSDTKKDFVRYREELKRQGVEINLAWQMAWKKIEPLHDQKVLALAHAKVADLINPVSGGGLVSTDASETGPHKGSVNFRSDIEWAYLNKNNKDALPGDAPNIGAYGLMLWARDNAHEFYTSIFSKVLPSKAAIDADAVKSDDGGVIGLLAEIERDIAHEAA
jgi:hypothetical protein